jgi:hypothetical protein
MKKINMIMLCHHFIVNLPLNSSLNIRSFFFVEDENAPVLPTVDEQNDNRMDIDGANQDVQHIPGVDDTTLLSNVSDEFVLPPISTTQTPAARQAVRRKRKLVVDETKEIDSGSMKTQLSDTTDIVGVLELAPPTRRLMHLKETGGIEKLFSLSATSIYSKSLQQVIAKRKQRKHRSIQQKSVVFFFI